MCGSVRLLTGGGDGVGWWGTGVSTFTLSTAPMGC